MAFLRQVRGSDDVSAVTPTEVRQSVVIRLEEQRILLAGLDAEIDARRRWTGKERRKTAR